tara:strand:- start:162 stop:752 length:591 start_codon:yes stop_codon:yes gene_type:complete
MSFRKEKKYRLSFSDLSKLKSLLVNSGMTEIYPKRKIFSKYFDTLDLKMFNDSEEGLLPRKKIRIRWYNYESKINLETKISSIEGRFKKSKLINNIKDDDKFYLRDNFYGKIYPSILVSYKREYYQFKKLRLTFDTNIQYTDLQKNKKIVYSDKEVVMEVKTDSFTPDDYIDDVVKYPTTRFSKYSRGVLFAKGLL